MLYPLSGPESVSTLMCIKDVPGLYHMDGRECQGHAWTLLQVRGRELENLVGAFKEVMAEEGEVDAFILFDHYPVSVGLASHLSSHPR